jgi:hypothetical protein
VDFAEIYGRLGYRYFATYNAEKSPQPGEDINRSHKNTLFAADNLFFCLLL